MNKLLELFEKVKEEHLDRHQLEMYRDEIAHVMSGLQLELGGVKKKKAQFMGTSLDKKQTELDREWEATEAGLREIELKALIRATSPILSSLRDRIFNKI